MKALTKAAPLLLLLGGFIFPLPAAASAPPSIEGEGVSNVTATDAALEATINPSGLSTTYHFHLESGCLSPRLCPEVTVYPLPSGEIPARSHPQSVSLDLNDAGVTLQPDTEYAYWVEAGNAAGPATGEEKRFTTPGKPVIESESLSHLTATDATLEAQINTEGLETEYEFELWHSLCGPGCEAMEVFIPLPSGRLLGSFISQSVSLDLNSASVSLTPGGWYSYSAKATNSRGSSSGAWLEFVAPEEEPAMTPPKEATVDGQDQTLTTPSVPPAGEAEQISPPHRCLKPHRNSRRHHHRHRHRVHRHHC